MLTIFTQVIGDFAECFFRCRGGNASLAHNIISYGQNYKPHKNLQLIKIEMKANILQIEEYLFLLQLQF